jgi:hypothetical protein
MGSYPYRDALGEELVHAIRRRSQRAPRRTAIALAMAAAALLASAAGVWLVLGGADSATTRPNPPAPSPQPGLAGDPMVAHNGLDRTTLAAAERDAKFTLLVPDDPAANLDSMTGVFDDQTGTTLTLEFPPPDETSSDLSQPYISIYEDNSPGNWATPKEDISAEPDAGKTLCEIQGQPAVCVEARSPSDSTRSNAAYIRTVIDHTTVELSGGDNLEVLQRIGNTMTAAASSD